MKDDQETIQRLKDAFTLFAKAEWRQKPVNGLTRSDIRILFCIMESECSGNPKPRISDLSKKLLVTTPTVTQLIKKLIEEELIERTVDPDDRRSVGIELTEKGKAVAMEADASIKQTLGGLIDHLGAEESDHLADLLTKAYHYFNNR
ncbi:MarR family winged helix-turn-helix transcriptional regulator [Paenibacillus sacheonensis]|uniref:MarR family transcriptional regulator n=1 Tax=Paenibacillus sacheonensis TaxID=742054 RepID=A0A7X4YTW7_9BACL|nr:MarR family transcriptional regulator [Paenibacillus sacheonensis]MBM7568619.1 DNA-binding MarR family transcriptional regulator [Paenibacillus sacheonensis]NBC72487.1 MarR family transcriptional regulator [Paenibacillus sacheonensis]